MSETRPSAGPRVAALFLVALVGGLVALALYASNRSGPPTEATPAAPSAEASPAAPAPTAQELQAAALLADRRSVRVDMKAFRDAINLYRLNMGYYPAQFQDLWAAPANAGRRWKGPYLKTYPPKDPWGNEYVYELGRRPPTIVSYGADGQPGGDGAESDLSSDDPKR